MFISTTENIPGASYRVLGIAQGAVVQSKHIGRDFMAGLKTIVGGEIKGYTEMMQEARAIATRRMCEQAAQMGADGIVNVRYATSAVVQNAAEVLAYGTAVKLIAPADGQ
ncbi:MAG: heavy metal-binding domain-containing protein [Kiritimatiellae bacterium]|nr:heavy metal-binding domain-containing protein [Thermoguttaceae bacterium]MBR4938011.1 heavy metal-binding domain-containing protein [Kiritimatiellia bacterium]